jgi:tryptophan synthase alpha chain
MKNRLLVKLKEAKGRQSKLFCAFLTLGYPNLKTTKRLIKEFERLGVDILELGFPFSDPLADGPTIQYSSEYALEKGVRLRHAFQLVRKMRDEGIQIPILFFTYFNPIFHYGIKRFVVNARQAGLDGFIVPDLPPEEESDFQSECRRQRLAQVYLVAPTTEEKRAIFIARKSQGFVYYVSLRGVTGARKSLPNDLLEGLKAVRRVTRKPILVGFGVSTPEQAKVLARASDGVIVGSAIMDRLRRSHGKTADAVRLIRAMVQAVKG